MNGKEALKAALTSTQGMLGMFLGDLSDADLRVRPVPGGNHIAWQLGHLIYAESHLVNMMLPDVKYPPLPAGFADRYGAKGAPDDSPEGLLTKAEYLDLFNQRRAITLAAVDKLTDADLDRKNTGSMAPYAPTLGNLLILVSNHVLMHAGQFSVVRRKLGKPVLF